MLDDGDAVAAAQEGVEGFEQPAYVVEVQARGRFVEDEHRGGGLLLCQIVGQLDALVLAAGQGGRRLAQFDVSQADVLQGLELAGYLPLLVGVEELDGLVDRHLQHVVDVGVVEADLQHILLEPLSVARFALQHQVGHELHLHRDGALALALLAPSALAVEAERARRVAHLLRQRLVGVELAYVVISLQVGHRVAARRLADGVLVDELHVAQVLQVAPYGDELARAFATFVQLPLQGAVEDVAHQGRLARATDARHHRHHVQRKAYVDTLQVVLPCAPYLDVAVPRAAHGRHGDGLLAQQVAHRVAGFS